MINFEGKAYPTRFGFRVIEKWENEAGLKISQIGSLMQGDNVGGSEMILMLKLAYYAIESGCKRESQELPFDIDYFIESVEISDFSEIMQTVTDGITPKGTENKRQPKAKS